MTDSIVTKGNTEDYDQYLQKVIDDNYYKGVVDQDGWETAELTIRANHSTIEANYILEALKG